MVGLASGLSTALPRSNSTQAGCDSAAAPADGQLPTVWAKEGAANRVLAAIRARARDLVMGDLITGGLLLAPARQTAGDRCRRTSCRRRSWSGRRIRPVRRLRRLLPSGGP